MGHNLIDSFYMFKKIFFFLRTTRLQIITT